MEALFGEALALAPGLRERIQLVNAARPGNAIKHCDSSAAHVRAAVENSLKALRTDRLDLLLIHRPDALLDADELAGQLGVSLSTLALAWLLRLPCKPLPIVGSHRVQALDDARAALALQLSAQDWYRVWTAAAGREVA